MQKIKKMLPVLVFVFLIFSLTGMGLAGEKQTYSVTEKRQLQTLPKVSKKAIKKGKFQKQYEAYLSDQFPGRDDWVLFQTNISRLLGKKESNGVYFGKDAYLLEKYDQTDFPKKRTKKNIQKLADLVEAAGETARVKVMMVPTKTWLLQDKLPACAPTYEEQTFFDAIETALGARAADVLVPVQEALQAHAEEDIFYRTDHHWTTLGAWYGYQAYLEAVGADVSRAEEKKDFQKVSDAFYGSTYAKVRQAKQADEISIYEPKLPLQVIYNMGEKMSDSLYDMQQIGTTDEYRVFTGGNQAVIEISGGERNGKTLLVFKDSFANCLIPFLAEDFEKVVVVDLRQLNVGSEALLEMFAPTDVLILYNSAQFAKERK